MSAKPNTGRCYLTQDAGGYLEVVANCADFEAAKRHPEFEYSGLVLASHIDGGSVRVGGRLGWDQIRKVYIKK